MPEGHSDNKQLPKQGRSPERLSVAPQHFYRTAALPCPYLPGKIERKLVTELAGRHAGSFYNELSRAGFRRSHHLAYRPACVGCGACIPVRIPVADFVESKSVKLGRKAGAWAVRQNRQKKLRNRLDAIFGGTC